MKTPIDLTGQVFNYWTILGSRTRTYTKNNNLVVYWKCQCKCGIIKYVTQESVVSGKSISCGCYRGEKARKNIGESSINSIKATYKHNAKRKNRIFSLDDKTFKYLIFQNCFYCGIEPKQIFTPSDKTLVNDWKQKGKIIYNGIDRIDSSKGYEIDNVVTCCGFCNIAKHNLSQDEFLNKIKQIYERHKLNG